MGRGTGGSSCNSQGIQEPGEWLHVQGELWPRAQVGEAGWGDSTPLLLVGQGPLLWTGHTLVLPPLPPCLGLLPYSLAFLLFWFNKTVWSLAARGWGRCQATP